MKIGARNQIVGKVTEVKKGPIADSAWALPTGYKKVDSPAAKPDLAAGNASRRIEEADHGRPRHRLASPRLADDPQHLARGDREGDPVDGVE